jgi:hypothetical protein
MTTEALEACQHIGVNPDTLQIRNAEDFKTSSTEVPELAEVRYNHY